SKEHRAFHTALAAACGSPTLLDIRERLFDRIARYVALSILSRAATRNDAAEHEQIMRAALSRNGERAVVLNREHIERTAEKVLKSLATRDRSRSLRALSGKAAK
ncbi:MAG: FCD domain-containing protein, partial [Pseudomonadota bacterium]